MSLMPVEEALRRILETAEPLAIEHVPLDQAHGRVLAEPLAATRDQPPFPASAMDGYAVRTEDVAPGQRLTVVGRSVAGKRHSGGMGPRETVRIFTGAPIPHGADAVLIQEDAEVLDNGATIVPREHVTSGQFVRPKGLDFRAGDTLLEPNRRLDPSAVALAASLNHPVVSVRRRPRVGILANGDELVAAGETPGPDQIVASNNHALYGMVQAEGGMPIDLGIARDDKVDIANRIGMLTDLDILVTLGGASVGDHDLVQEVLGNLGMTLGFWRIAMRPGKPLMFGQLGQTRVLGLPGNPVSAIVCAKIFLMPLINTMHGLPNPRLETIRARLGAPLPENDRRQDYLRAQLDKTPDGPVVTAFGKQDSSMLAILARANALIVRAPFAPPVAAGSVVEVLALP